MSEITAAEARAKTQSSTYGAAQVIAQISQSIEANSTAGSTFITQILSKESVSETELQSVIATLEARGFTVERIGETESHLTIKVSW